ncbi:hypothetical protein FGG08_004839 [Glutinoglossum americanum]|uniref:Zn(2)-C6 fungal-type domain-containing protein n=1 Tax=Glutinoglossum americanum TaxID=1670608 RepID=A0A9P8L3I6_9PEZI|nr:hypothetical protein FGG08_004839 [Glutinoglossum americanum]
MSFARRDLLQRHFTAHGKENQDSNTPVSAIALKNAGRTPIACSNCAKTKTKCDKKFPCSRCAARNLPCNLRLPRRPHKAIQVAQPSAQLNGLPDQSSSSNSNSDNNSSSSSVSPHNGVSPRMHNGVVNILPREGSTNPHSEQSPPKSHPSAMQAGSPPIPNDFTHMTPLSGYDEFRDVSDRDNHQYMMDWSTLSSLPLGYDTGRSDILSPPGAESNSLVNGDVCGAGSFMQSMEALSSPMQPRTEPAFSNSDLGSPLIYSNNVVGSVIMDSMSVVQEIEVIITAQEGWTAFRCNPPVPSSTCPRTAKFHLERLEHILSSHEAWDTWDITLGDANFTSNDRISIAPFAPATRDKILAITQSFLHKALDIHRIDHGSPGSYGSPNSNNSRFIILPPPNVLEDFLRAYVNTFEHYYTLVSAGELNTNDLMMQLGNDKAASLLILLMIAQGAMVIPNTQARYLTGGLAEACRISLFDIIEKDILLSADPTVLRCALLFTIQAAWSGDKWHMDIAMGQRGMYIAMLKHAGMLEPRQMSLPAPHNRASTDMIWRSWREWIKTESRSRLIYSWVMAEQELSLFHDTASMFDITELGAAMPDTDRLWNAKNSSQWLEEFERTYDFSGGYQSPLIPRTYPLSLRELFRHFLDDDIIRQNMQLTPLQLRLLLHPLQGLVWHLRQLLSCFSDSVGSRKGSRTVTRASTQVRLDEVQTLLQRWYDLSDHYTKNSASCPVTQANLVMFHLITLNTVTSFADIEQLARREGLDGTYQQLKMLQKRCIQETEEAYVHCGQVLRLIRSMPKAVRPPWWPAAVYRVSLILWTGSVSQQEFIPQGGVSMYADAGPTFAIDNLPLDHHSINQYLRNRDSGVPMLTKRDGSLISFGNPHDILMHCIEILGEGVPTRFSEGIGNKLKRLVEGWINNQTNSSVR